MTMIAGCYHAPPSFDPVYAVDLNLEEQYFQDCIHNVKDFNNVIVDGLAWNNLQRSCRYASRDRAYFKTTNIEFNKHSDWEHY